MKLIFSPLKFQSVSRIVGKNEENTTVCITMLPSSYYPTEMDSTLMTISWNSVTENLLHI